ncbi:MAG: divalent metal cation transporter [Planctomycetota bacterium]|nr:MAG: divalent metal cation transporter [Planctomycetota bacterium]
MQATRAGAGFGFGMLGLLVLACVTKYPFLEFGPRYAAATGEDLVEGYRKLGAWAVWVCAIVTFGSMFIVMAAVTMVTAAIAQFIASMYLPGMQHVTLVGWCGVVIGVCLSVLLAGRYRVLERTMKVVMAVLLMSTVAAVVVAALGGHDTPAVIPADSPKWWGPANFAFLLAFMGWMPIPIDSAIWNSIWVREHGRAQGRAMTLREAILDYRTGYITAGAVAVLFLALGALVMRGRVTEVKDGAGFVQQLITVYSDTLGAWSVPIIALAALTTMFSTTLVVLDAFPRAMHRLTQAIAGISPDERRGRAAYVGWVVGQASMAMLILAFSLKSMKTMVDVATTLSFLTAPVLAVINYLVITRLVPPEARPGRGMRVLSVASIVFLIVFGGAYGVWLVVR